MNEVNIGAAIGRRLKELHMTKTEFGRRLGMPQQNVNRILRDKFIKTDKLAEICDILGYNFFQLYCDDSGTINAVASGESSIAAICSEVQGCDSERVKYLERILAEKERFIQFLIKDSETKKVE